MLGLLQISPAADSTHTIRVDIPALTGMHKFQETKENTSFIES